MEQLNGHPFICSLQYAFQTEGRLYLCMDYASGGQLLQHIDARSPMDEEDVKVSMSSLPVRDSDSRRALVLPCRDHPRS
jgi:serine/threonine protein kinase